MGHWITNTQFTCTLDTQHTQSPTPTTSPFLLLWCWIAMEFSRFEQKFFFFQISLLWSSSPMGFLSHWSKCPPPQLTTEFFQSAPESVPIECHDSPHFPLFCHTLQYELIKYPHFTHASWHWMMYSLSIFWNKKTHVLNCQTKIYLIWPNFSCKNFPSKVSIKFANKKKHSLSLLLVVCAALPFLAPSQCWLLLLLFWLWCSKERNTS